jgi:hypothetical protein
MIKKNDDVICVSSYYDHEYGCNDPEKGWTGTVDEVSTDGTIAWVTWHGRGYCKSVSINRIEKIDTAQTKLVNRVLSVFDEELQNTPNYSRRRASAFSQVCKILYESNRKEPKQSPLYGNNRQLKIEVWEAIHIVQCWWNETPIKGGSIDLKSLESTMIEVIKSHQKAMDK